MTFYNCKFLVTFDNGSKGEIMCNRSKLIGVPYFAKFFEYTKRNKMVYDDKEYFEEYSVGFPNDFEVVKFVMDIIDKNEIPDRKEINFNSIIEFMLFLGMDYKPFLISEMEKLFDLSGKDVDADKAYDFIENIELSNIDSEIKGNILSRFERYISMDIFSDEENYLSTSIGVAKFHSKINGNSKRFAVPIEPKFYDKDKNEHTFETPNGRKMTIRYYVRILDNYIHKLTFRILHPKEEDRHEAFVILTRFDPITGIKDLELEDNTYKDNDFIDFYHNLRDKIGLQAYEFHLYL